MKGHTTVKLILLLLASFCIFAQNPTGALPQAAITGLGPGGRWLYMQTDVNGNLELATTQASSSQGGPPGFVPPYAMVGKAPDGTWRYLQTDINGNLMSAGSPGFPASGPTGATPQVCYYPGTGTTCNWTSLLGSGIASLSASNTFTALQTYSLSGLGITSADVVYLVNPTPAAIGAQQVCPNLDFGGQGYGTTGSASQPVNWILTCLPIQGSTAPTSQFLLKHSINSGAFTTDMTCGPGIITVNGSAGCQFANIQLPSSSQFVMGGANQFNTGTTGTALIIETNGAASNSSGTFVQLELSPLYNQTSTAAGTDLYINRTETVVGSGAQYFLNMAVAGAQKASIDHTGMIQQSTEKSCSTGLTTDSSGNINGCVASDRRLKKNIKTLPMTNALMTLTPRFYEWNDPVRDASVHVGFVAQEVQKVFPEAVVNAGGNGDKGVDPNAILALVVKTVQNQDRTIQELKKQIRDLKHRARR